MGVKAAEASAFWLAKEDIDFVVFATLSPIIFQDQEFWCNVI
jgi:3-oxoacyl-[acyl-carrier-protein] synthase III